MESQRYGLMLGYVHNCCSFPLGGIVASSQWSLPGQCRSRLTKYFGGYISEEEFRLLIWPGSAVHKHGSPSRGSRDNDSCADSDGSTQGKGHLRSNLN